LAVTIKIDEKTKAELSFKASDLISPNPVGYDLDGSLSLSMDDGGTVKIGGDIDLLTTEIGIYAQYIGMKISEDGKLNSRIKVNLPDNTWYGVSTLIYNLNEDAILLIEARYDSDGAENFGAEAQMKYAVNENIDIKFGIEYNDWSDNINDWSKYTIKSSTDRIYAEFVFKF